MKNFVFISPHFPKAYYNFCRCLKSNGLRVLGIADEPYEDLLPELRESLTEYYRVPTLEDYDEMVKALGYFTFKYGKIDWLESNNEYWLRRDARLRTDFNIVTGAKTGDVDNFTKKSEMKQFYLRAKVPTAKYHLVSTYEKGKEFVDKVGFPVVVKPDIGVGAAATYPIRSEEELRKFYDNPPKVPYIMEQMLSGRVVSFDGIVNSKGKIIFTTSNVFSEPLMEIVNNSGDLSYYTDKSINPKLANVGARAIKAFGIKSRFFHTEYFELDKDIKGTGKKGDFVGLEVNMRPPGGLTPDMMNYANSVDVYKIWADMVAFDEVKTKFEGGKFYCVFASRRDNYSYAVAHSDILDKYSESIVMQACSPLALSSLMGNQYYLAKFKTLDELNQFVADVNKRI